ncbi:MULTISPECIES: ligase-associated DNA damage response DEXH box helicase [unclassified Sphingobacterium]|uniref:ligase-associated DNA damage response DEXH box helicase n=1 Tax=unclassified Sphingobacterium TaxID=2609468 RepID=UPI0010539E61|nr:MULTISPECIES: ligase-associated DNA damage response DEXH box helicase [unclassified Sphingobacterium]MCS3552483.1 ATP-dependent Lhr-like helicase [Sphingobacterium sp. JUb21]TCR10755.1 ATP-dependent Lhr-like helicase [Sphingobacterium sp. JUb20]
MKKTVGYQKVVKWLKTRKRKPFPFQEETWASYLEGYSGLVNAPTGFGKTYSVFLAPIIAYLNEEGNGSKRKGKLGLRVIWITPLRSLAKDLARAMEEALFQLDVDWRVGVRNGDTSVSEKQKQKRAMPQVLLITPESLHLLLAQKNNDNIFDDLTCIVADEWHELLGTKRGVMVELALSRIKGMVSFRENRTLRIWGISATIGNLEEALAVLQPDHQVLKIIVKAATEKKIQIQSIIPDTIEMLPWAGHLGIKLADKLVPVIKKSKTTLVFTNTRSQAEIWFQHLLKIHPDFAGQMAIHHGSIDYELRNWIEEALHTGVLKVVICTSSLDLGVDFKPVDTVVQVGSPKGVARFLQRAGRSGHSPFETSKIYFMPTHALELLEVAAIKTAAKTQQIESREPFILPFDVLLQYLVTLAVGNGFDNKIIFEEVKNTYAFSELLAEEFDWCMQFITQGGSSLQAYPEFHKVVFDETDGLWKVTNRQIAMRHRLHIGTIVSDAMLKVKFMTGGYVGMVEEYFVSKLKPGDRFNLAGRSLEFVMVRDMLVLVKRSQHKKTITPSWLGGRLPLSSNLGAILRQKYSQVLVGEHKEEELKVMKPLFELQESITHVPRADEFLVELIHTKEGYHLFAYPFEGRLVHEVMAALIAYRISRLIPITFSIAMNDYGFELLSDQEIPMDDAIVYDIFSPDNLSADISASINATEMAKRKFRDIACISGLVFQGYPGKYLKNKQIQSSSALFFDVFESYDPKNLLLRQAYDENFHYQLEEPRLLHALNRIQQSTIVLKWAERFTPFSFPIKVDSMRESMSSEELEARIEKMKAAVFKNLD